MSEFTPRIIAFYCSNCASSAATVSEGMKKALPDNVKMVHVPCSGRVEILHLLKPFEEGADGVYIAGCQSDSCQYMNGIGKATRRVTHVKGMLESLGIEPERIEVFNLGAGRGGAFVDTALEMTEKLRAMGPVMPA